MGVVSRQLGGAARSPTSNRSTPASGFEVPLATRPAATALRQTDTGGERYRIAPRGETSILATPRA
jgi:hypothetical protein